MRRLHFVQAIIIFVQKCNNLPTYLLTFNAFQLIAKVKLCAQLHNFGAIAGKFIPFVFAKLILFWAKLWITNHIPRSEHLIFFSVATSHSENMKYRLFITFKFLQFVISVCFQELKFRFTKKVKKMCWNCLLSKRQTNKEILPKFCVTF